MINYRLKIDFCDSKTLASDICFVSGDVKSSTLYFEFYNDGKRVDISGYTLSVRAKRSDGVVVASSGKIKDNTAVFTPESNMYCIPGEIYIEIALADSSGRYATTKIITAEVIEGLGEAAIEGVDDLNIYVQLLSDAISAKEAAEAAAKAAAEAENELADVNTSIANINESLKDTANALNKKIDDASELLGKNALKGNVSGEVIRIDDVSPIEHAIKVNISGEDILDMSSVKVHTLGKNIFGIDESFTETKGGITVDYDSDTQIFTLNGTYEETSALVIFCAKYTAQNTNFNTFKLNTKKMLTFTVERIGGTVSGEYGTNVIAVTGSNKPNASNYQGTPTLLRIPQDKSVKSTYPGHCYIHSIYFHFAHPVTFTNYKMRVQIEIGENSTECEKYKRVTTYSANSNGMLEIPSVSPTMTLLTDTKGVNIEAEYNKDINKAFEELQNAIISLGGNV